MTALNMLLALCSSNELIWAGMYHMNLVVTLAEDFFDALCTSAEEATALDADARSYWVAYVLLLHQLLTNEGQQVPEQLRTAFLECARFVFHRISL